MNTFKSAAIRVLQESGTPLHYKDITRLALEKGLIETEGKTPEATMNALIITDIKNKGNASDFVKTDASTYALNKKKESIADPKKEEAIQVIEKAEEDKQKIESSFTGVAGEYLVCSELLFRGFNASMMSVDDGVDIVAVKDERLYAVQVKAANLSATDVYNFNVRKVSFERHDSSHTYYIFVLHESNGKNDFLILPYLEMQKKIHEKAILEVWQGKLYRVVIKFRDGHVYLGSMDHNTDYFLNNWDVIK